MNRKLLIIALLLLCSSQALWAQEEAPDPIEHHTFPPELVMRHQHKIGLSEEQRELIKEDVLTAQARFTELQWDLEQEMEAFVELLRQERVNERQALDVLGRILALESSIKQTHLVLAIRIKNALTPEQQAELREIRQSY